MTLPVLLSIPHGATFVPDELAPLMVATSKDIFEDGDPFTELLYDLGSDVSSITKASVARAVVDLNRQPDDRPPANPDGVVKSETCHGVRIWNGETWRDDDFVERLLDQHYHPFHHTLSQEAAQPGLELGLDCHSMAAVPPAIAPDSSPRPLMCLSNRDGETCDPRLLASLARVLAESFDIGLDQIGLNRPFRGGHITARHGNDPLPWVQLELNRSMYLQPPWFDEDRRRLDPGKVSDFRERLVRALGLLFGAG